MNDYQENFQYTDNYGDGGFESQKDFEESTRSEKNLKTDSWLKAFYRGQSLTIVAKSNYCLRHQHSFKGKSCDQCSH